MATRLAQVGLGQWGKNLARNFADLSELAWLCDVDDGRHAELAQRYPQARLTAKLDDVLADGSVDATETAWLRSLLLADGVIDEREKRLLREIRSQAKEVSPEFQRLYDECLKR